MTLRLATGALWGVGAMGLVAAHLRTARPLPVLAAGALAGVLAARLRPRAPSLGHPAAAALAALAAILATRFPEPAVFLLVPLVAAAFAWPVKDEPGPDPLTRAVPGWALPATFAAGFAAFFLQSANRYWQYGAGSKDLGLFYQTHWLLAHRLPPENTVMGMHALADHMELLDYLIAPLLLVHDSPATLLFVQALAVASAVFPLYGLATRLLEGTRAGLAVAWVWLLSPDLHAGVMFDYNPMLPGTAALVWTAWALLTRGMALSLALALLACLAREDLCLYVAALALVLAFRGAPWRRAAAVAVLALGLFAFEMFVLFPRFREGGFRHFDQFTHALAGDGASAASRPAGIAGRLVDHPQKRRSLLQPLGATGFLGAADPLTFALQVPNWVERFLSDTRTRWWGYHYGVPAAATAVLGAIFGWRRLRQAGRARPATAVYVVLCALLFGLFPPWRSALGNRRSDLYHLRQPYVMAAEDVASADAAVRYIGRNPYVAVAAQDRLLPRLAGRRTILLLDRAQEAEVIALQLNGATWPEGRPAWRRRVHALAQSRAYGVAFCAGQTVVLRRGAPSLSCPAWERFLADPPPASP